ncbi:MAG: AMP-binding protein [Phenylobacterium sp.]|nr:AMP-binding protein [Phenylobacterium sp.]MCW5758507.1 AMP-binding protein [Phenylobacterium sp.]
MAWCFAALWDAVAEAIPDAPAVAEGAIRRTWRTHEDRAARLAGALVAAGLGPDSKVAIYGYNSAAYVEALYAVLKARCTPVNVNYRYAEQELTYLFDNADAEAVIFDARFGPRLAAILPSLPKLKLLVEIDDGSGERLPQAARLEALAETCPPLAPRDYSEDDILMLYTGGTTGLPKGVMYRQGDYSRAMLAGFDRMGLPRPATREELQDAVRRLQAEGRAPVSTPACPLMHGTGQNGGVLMPHAMGGCVVLFRNTRFDADALWRLVEAEAVSDLTIVGDAFARPMLDALEAAEAAGRPYDVSSLRRILSSGVMFSRETKEGLLRFADITIMDSMGASEGGMAVSVVSRASPPGETARFVANPSTRVFREDGREVTPGSDEVGLIANGGFSPIGYYKDPEKTAATFRVIDGQRYSFPGDFARVAADGGLILLGRGSNCINTGGEKVFPEEVEEALKAHPAVADALVVGLPDPRFGERIVAVVAAAPGEAPDEAALIAAVRARLADYKRPRAIVFADEVRRAPNGKADYAWAKATAAGALAPAEAG